jgi:lanthanide-dependent methanol dehydrogenase
MTRVSRFFMAATLAFGVAACTSATPTPETASTASAAAGPDKEWTMPNKDQASTRFSTLNEITADNVKDLKVAWTFSTGVLRGHEGEPLVVGDTMYLATPFPIIVYALDLS